MSERPEFIKHWREIQQADDARYPGSKELLSIGSNFGKAFGMQKVGFNHDVLPPGRRTSWPHAERDEEEFVFVVEGAPDVWIDGVLYRLQPGDAVGFPAGTGVAHTFINNTQDIVRLLVGGERNRPDSQCHYPLHPKRNAAIEGWHWQDAPTLLKGNHDGLPDALRAHPLDPADSA
jgi:uncharacterized cupin superfamily protein